MSLLLAYHDSKRAVVCSDDRGIRFNQAGQAEPVAERIPKFVQAGDFIFASLGRSDVAATLLRGTALMIAAQPQVTIASLGEILPGILKEAFSRRPRRDVSNVPLGVESDGIETALLGFDHDSGRVRSFIFASVDDFAPVETTADPYARIFALGAYGPDDHPLLLRLTERMKVAAKMHIPWIASELRTTAGEMHRRYPVAVGQPSYFAALDANGFVSLPENFPPLPSPVPELHHAVHLVTTNKEQALNAAGQFFLGSIMTPRAGAPDTIGNNDGGSGAQSGQLNILLMSASATNGLGGSGILGNGAVTNLPNSVDGDLTTKGTLTVTGNGAGNEAIVLLSGPPGITRRYQTVTLKLRVACLTNNLSPASPFATFGVTYSTTGPTGSFTTIVSVVSPATFALQTVSVSLPAGVNPSQVCVLVGATAFNTSTSGQCIVDLYEAWIEAVE